MVLILIRNKKKLHISSQTKFLNKAIGLIISVTNFFLFVPLLSFKSKMFSCSPEESDCYGGTHLAIICFVILSLLVQLLLNFYSLSMMTSSYPNEDIPWSHFPSKVPYFKTIFKIAVIIVFQTDSKQVIVVYANAVFTLCIVGFLYYRLTHA
jgi:hypothetical protein